MSKDTIKLDRQIIDNAFIALAGTLNTELRELRYEIERVRNNEMMREIRRTAYVQLQKARATKDDELIFQTEQLYNTAKECLK